MRTIMVFLLTVLIVRTTNAQHVRHVHNKTGLFRSCWLPAPAPVIQSPRVDLGRLEATVESIKEEQRYQTHIMTLMYGQMQRSADLQLLGQLAQLSPAGAGTGTASPVPDPNDVSPTPIPSPSQVQPTPVPPPSQTSPTPIPLPNQVIPTPVPAPPGASGGGSVITPNGPAVTPTPTPIPETGRPVRVPLPTAHRSWPQVARK